MKPFELSQRQKDYVDKEVTARKALYREAKELMHGQRQIRFMRVKPRGTSAAARLQKGLRVPFAHRLVQTAVGVVQRGRLRVRIVPRKPGAESVAEDLQQGAQLLMQAFERTAHKPLAWKLADQVCGDGMGVAKVARIPWAGYPIREGDEIDKEYNKRVDQFLEGNPPLPLRMRLVDPLTFYPPLTEWGTGGVLESAKRPTRETFRALNLGFVKNSRMPRVIPEGQPYPQWEPPPSVGASIDMDELWIDEEVVIRFGDGTKLAFKNDESVMAGKAPYAWCMGQTTGLDDPAIGNLSVMFPLIYLAPYFETALADMANWVRIASKPTTWTARDANAPGGASEGVNVVKFIPGKMYDFGPGGKGGFMEPPGVGREIVDFINLLITIMDRVSLAPVTAGFIGTRTPGTTQQAAMEAATAILTPIVENLQFCYADVINLCFHAIVNVIRKPITVSGWTFSEKDGAKTLGRYALSPTNIKGHDQIAVDLGMTTLQDEISRGTHAAFMVNSGLWSELRGMRYSGVEDTWAETSQKAKEIVFKLPAVQAYFAQRAISEEPGLNEYIRMLEEQGLAPEDVLEGVRERVQGGPGQGLGQRNLGGQPKRGGGRPASQPTQRRRGPSR